MTRKEEIYKATRDYLFNFFIPSGVRVEEWNTCFEAGANWADEHPKNPWRDASKELPKSANEVFIYAGGVTTIGRYIQDENIWRVPVFGAIEDAEYWMPIPELKEEREYIANIDK